MMEWLTSIALSWALDNIVPIVLTLLLGVVGAKIKHIKDVLQVFADAMADGKISKDEWKDIRATVKTLIGR